MIKFLAQVFDANNFGLVDESFSRFCKLFLQVLREAIMSHSWKVFREEMKQLQSEVKHLARQQKKCCQHYPKHRKYRQKAPKNATMSPIHGKTFHSENNGEP